VGKTQRITDGTITGESGNHLSFNIVAPVNGAMRHGTFTGTLSGSELRLQLSVDGEANGRERVAHRLKN
jgi:hypothetical protein